MRERRRDRTGSCGDQVWQTMPVCSVRQVAHVHTRSEQSCGGRCYGGSGRAGNGVRVQVGESANEVAVEPRCAQREKRMQNAVCSVPPCGDKVELEAGRRRAR